MKDRLVEFPNRYRIVPVEGATNVVDLLPVTGVVTDEGTPLNKHTLLRDATAALYRLGPDAVVNDVFMALKMPAGYYGFEIMAKFSDGTPASGLQLDGLLSFEGSTAVTDENGFCYAMAVSTSPTITFNQYIGIKNSTITIQADSDVLYTPIDLVIQKATEVELASSNSLIFPYAATIDICAIGGGGAGARSTASNSDNRPCAGGGGGGYLKNLFNVSVVAGDVLSCTIGAGGSYTWGSGDKNGDDGGTTTVSLNGKQILQASGGAGGTARGNGGRGGSGGSGGGGSSGTSSTAYAGVGGSNGGNGETVNGSDGGTGQGTSTRKFGEADGTLYCGGGGGASSVATNVFLAATGGAGGGGSGAAIFSSTDNVRGGDATNYGGGGGGAANNMYSSSNNNTAKYGAGRQGVVFVRW